MFYVPLLHINVNCNLFLLCNIVNFNLFFLSNSSPSALTHICSWLLHLLSLVWSSWSLEHLWRTDAQFRNLRFKFWTLENKIKVWDIWICEVFIYELWICDIRICVIQICELQICEIQSCKFSFGWFKFTNRTLKITYIYWAFLRLVIIQPQIMNW